MSAGGQIRQNVINKLQFKNRASLRLGFVPLTDCAPVVMAHELGLFRKYGLRVTLHRELGWATVRDKIIYRELEAAHALAAMPIAATLGLGSPRCECLTGLVLNLHGNAITLSKDLRDRGACDSASLRQLIAGSGNGKILTFGTVAPFSSHSFLLRQWLAHAGIHPDRDVRIVIVPPPQMVPNLKAGHLDGFCVGEPWNSLAVQARAGWCAAVSAELAPGHPEKVVMVRSDFAREHAEEHEALLAALLEACEFCDQPENRAQLVATLAEPQYVGASEAALRAGFLGEFDFGDQHVRTVPDFVVFHRHETNEPSASKAGWVLQQMRNLAKGADLSQFVSTLGRRVFRTEIFDRAVQLRGFTKIAKSVPNETLFAVH